MVELPHRQVFESAKQAEQILAEEAARAPAAEAPAMPVSEAPVVEVPAADASVAEAPKKTGRRIVKRAVIAAALLAGVAFAGDFGYRYWTVGRFIETTDDAYVKADYTTVAPKVAGYISQVLVNDNDAVKAGQVLARIDDRDFQAALSQARADVKAAEAAITNIDAQISLQQSVIEQARATIDASQASLEFAVSDAARSARLITNGAGTQSRAEQTQSARDQAAAASATGQPSSRLRIRCRCCRPSANRPLPSATVRPPPPGRQSSTSPIRTSSLPSTARSAPGRSASVSMSLRARS